MDSGIDSQSILVVIEAKIVAAICRFRTEAAAKPLECCFSPDSKAVAVLWQSIENGRAKFSIRIYDIASNTELRRFSLKSKEVRQMLEWQGDRIYFDAAREGGRADMKLRGGVSIDVSENGKHEERDKPLLRGFDGKSTQFGWKLGSDWVMTQFASWEQPSTLKLWYLRLREKLGFNAAIGFVRIEMIDRETGARQIALPDLVGITKAIRPDGLRIATMSKYDGLAMWNCRPSSRWPMVIGIGTATSILILGLSQLLRRRRSGKPALPVPAENSDGDSNAISRLGD